MSDKAVVFIDGGYVSKMLNKHYSNTKIDFLKFSDALCGDCERFRTYYYTCPPYQSNPPTESERERKARFDKFLNTLKSFPRFEIRTGVLQKTKNPERPYIQKGVDVLLSIDLTEMSAKGVIDRAIIVSADSDFDPAIKKAKDNYVLVTLASFYQHKSHVLYASCDERISIDEDFIKNIALE